MGVAAYWRGSRAITRGIAMDLGEPDPFRAYIPTPRPATWGDRALDRACDLARRQVRGARRCTTDGAPFDPARAMDGLADYLWTQHRVGRETAQRAVEIVRAEVSRE